MILRASPSTLSPTDTFHNIQVQNGACVGVPASPKKLRGGSIAVDQELNPKTFSIRVAYQGEPGAYSEKATRELLGPNVVAIGRPSFEAAFRAVASAEVDYACLPIENSLGGSIHENYDLMLRYQL